MNEDMKYGEPQWAATEDDILRAVCTELSEKNDELRAVCSELALGPMETE